MDIRLLCSMLYMYVYIIFPKCLVVSVTQPDAQKMAELMSEEMQNVDKVHMYMQLYRSCVYMYMYMGIWSQMYCMYNVMMHLIMYSRLCT